MYPRSSIEKAGHQAWEQAPRHSQGYREAVHGLSSSRPGPLKGLPRDQRQNFESKAKTKSEHGNTWHSQGDRKAVHEPRSSRRRKRFSTTFQGQRQNFESRVKTKSEHGNKWHSQGDRKAFHEPRSSRPGPQKAFLNNLPTLAAEIRKQGQDKISRCVYPRS